jgi:NAD(P)-dependent dehydrogenase (short-subunit alcohol dehydrogenase family)
VVHLYGSDDELLADHAGRYLGEGLRRGDGLLLIATPAHVASIARRLARDGCDVVAATRSGQLVVLDAAETLARFMVNGEPCQTRFEQVVGTAVDALTAHMGHGRVRAFGEMVGLLWCADQAPAAIALEGLWNGLLESRAISLFCAYPIDAFHADVGRDALGALVGTHTHVLAGPRTLLSGSPR